MMQVEFPSMRTPGHAGPLARMRERNWIVFDNGDIGQVEYCPQIVVDASG